MHTTSEAPPATQTAGEAQDSPRHPAPAAVSSQDTKNPLPLLAGLAASAALAACGGGGGGGEEGTTASPGAGSALPGATHTAPLTDAEAARFLLQAQFSASTADIAALRSTTYASWLESQFSAPPSLSGWDWLNQRGYADVNKDTAYYDNTYPGDYMIWHQLLQSSDGVRKRVALALSEICVVSLSGLDLSWRSHALAWYWDQLVANAFGNYRNLLQDVTLNAAMGYYLNTRGNQKENAATGRQPDENYAREVMQLMSIGLVLLNPDGTPQRDSAGKPIDSYTQSDVTNLARVFTGYDYDQSQNTPTTVPGTTRVVPGTTFARLPMALTESRHSTLAASFLGTTIPANTPGAAALKTALDTLFNHPNVGPFIGKQLIQRLVTSNPSPAYVARVTAAFNNNGAGVRGDMRAVVRAILLDDEARAPAGLAQPGFGKLREPMLRFVQWGRTFGLESAQGSWKIGNFSDPGSRLGQSPLRSPSVFNFFRPGYIPPSTALAANGAVAPEFQLVNESSVGGYLNFMQGVIRNGIFVNAPELPHNASTANNGFDLKASYAQELALVADADALVARINLLMCAGQLSAGTVKLITDALKATNVTAASADNVRRDRVAAAVFLVMASAEYLIQK
ncbi:DUF1800 family protein [Acidovorax sp. A79]|uniref:DUF1800 domain-containing protein n=1 Tax=unclassified Acidovorax TaxID=2684926 RepID=UPI001C45069D|nr:MULTISPECIES: DUF1800 domain-containing protein [unclassified Acidovorax]MBV7429442.1 DUF1800 domain-containing protein [Acidovorax sp. sif0732]MBV7448520.1 DUF1800 domain-containing protein [Acidovorax sp. sif0715]